MQGFRAIALEAVQQISERFFNAHRSIPDHDQAGFVVLEVVWFPLRYVQVVLGCVGVDFEFYAHVVEAFEGANAGCAGGRGVAQELSERDREIAETLAPELKHRGILLAGLDVIGSNLTEVNVTSPTGFQEIMKQKDFDVAAMFADVVASWAKQ